MIKLLAIICLCVGLSIVSSQNCSATAALRRQFGFTSTGATPTTVTGLQHCASLKASGSTCCSADDINNLQTKTDLLIKNLTDTVAARDQYFAANAANALPRLRAATANFANTITTFRNLPAATAATFLGSQAEVIQILQDVQETSQSLIDSYAVAIPQISLSAFQASRTTCVQQMLKLQSTVWCLSCDPAAVSKGYNSAGSTLPLSANYCNKLKRACYPFVSTTLFQSGVIQVQGMIENMNEWTRFVNKVKAGTAVTEADITDTNMYPALSSPPDNCNDQASCDFICTGLFTNGLINRANLAAGGDTFVNSSRLLQEEEPRMLVDRRLQSGTYDPADDEAGVTVTFQDDPGNANKSGVLSFGSVLIGVIMLVSSYLL